MVGVVLAYVAPSASVTTSRCSPPRTTSRASPGSACTLTPRPGPAEGTVVRASAAVRTPRRRSLRPDTRERPRDGELPPAGHLRTRVQHQPPRRLVFFDAVSLR